MSTPTETVEPGHLYVVATPIGNLGDLSHRALKVLDEVDIIAAEDTRVTGVLLSHFGMRKRMTSLHEHNEEQATEGLLTALEKGRSVALVSDAGTPLVSDPGFLLVRRARAAGMPVMAVPGPCAAIAALSVSGLPTDQFVFAGFLPARAEARRHVLETLASERRTVILYESTHRILDSVQAIAEVLGPDRVVCLAREITKLHEQAHSAEAGELVEWLRQDPDRQRGEFVLVIQGTAREDDLAVEGERLLKVLLPELGTARSARVAAQLTGMPKKELYDMALRLEGKPAGGRARE